jgi:hypothetical protein
MFGKRKPILSLRLGSEKMRVCTYLTALSLSICCLFLGLYMPVQATPLWNFQTVDVNAAGYGNGYSPIVVDSNNTLHIAYTGHNTPNIYDIARYKSWNGVDWSTKEITYGAAVDLKVDTEGRPHILFETVGQGGLMYASWTGANWNIKTVDKDSGFGVIALDSTSNPHVAYLAAGSLLKYASLTGSCWNTKTVDSIAEGSAISLAIDSNNTPYIMYSSPSYMDDNQAIPIRAINVKLAILKNSSWSIEPVLANYDLGGYGNMILDSKGHPNFLYTQHRFVSPQNMTTISSILYARWNGTGWNTQTVVSNISLAGFGIGFLALDSRDYPHISYIISSLQLMYVSWTGTDWNIQPVAKNFPARGTCYLAIDSNSNPHISYRGIGPNQSGNGRLATIVYATTTNPTQSTQPSTSTPLDTTNLKIIVLAISTIVSVGVAYGWKKIKKQKNGQRQGLNA